MQRTVLYLFEIPVKSIPFALYSMAIDRVRIRKFTGISFSKSLGTGSGRTFTPGDADLLRWGMVVVIEEEEIAAFYSSIYITRWRKRATSEFQAVLAPISSHGLWSKRAPFTSAAAASRSEAQIMAITRARIKWHKNFKFWGAVPPVVTDLHNSPGLIAAIGIGEAPLGLQGTLSLWESGAALRDFAYKGQAHKVAIKQTEEINWYSEELFARFEVLTMRGSIVKKLAV